MTDKEDRVEFYEKSLDRVNYWLQFAETKHAALIAFLIAILAVVYSGNSFTNIWYRTILTVGYAISLTISMFSFTPIYKFDINIKAGEYLEKDNIIFWGDISKYSLTDYIKKVNNDIFTMDNENCSKEEKLLSEEIIINSRITNRKYILFKYALYIAIFFTILFPIFLIVLA